MSEWSALKERVAGRWQIPLFVFSLFMLAGAFLRVIPSATPSTFAEISEYLNTLVAGGLNDQVIQFGERLLADEEPHTPAELAPVHLAMARAQYAEAIQSRVQTAGAGQAVVEHYSHAVSGGLPLTVDDRVRRGWAYEWQRDHIAAEEDFRKAVDEGIEEASELRKHLVQLHREKLGTPPDEVQALLNELLAHVEDHRLDLRLWAIEALLEVGEELGTLEEAATLLVRNEDRFHGTDLQNRFDFLKALVLFRTGHYDDAETFLRTLRNRTRPGEETHAASGWLLGRVVLSDGEPQRPLEALSFFTDVIAHHPGSAYAAASRVGQAEAYVHLERHDDAISTYRMAIEDLEALRSKRLVDLEVLRTSLGVMADLQRQKGDSEASLAYIRLAVSLIDREDSEQAILLLSQLARALEQHAGQLGGVDDEAAADPESAGPSGSPTMRRLYAEAASTYLRLAKMGTLNESRSAGWNWQAAELFVKAGELARAVDLFHAFVAERPGNPLVPRAILRMAQLHSAMGHPDESIAAYQECYRRFPRTLDGSRALVPLAESYLAKGPGNEELAEKTLRIVLEDSQVFTPQAPEFANALFLLGDVLSRQGSYERAIATFEEALERYPDDPRASRAYFLLADAYRRSALALKEKMAEATFVGELQQMQRESTTRFEQAGRLYRRLIDEYEARGTDELTPLEELQRRHAALYEADCCFEIRDYRRALKLYEEAAAKFKNSSSGLAAYVQIINCHVFLSRPLEARAALARALILVDSIPGDAFDQSVSPETRDDWRRYFEWLGESELF